MRRRPGRFVYAVGGNGGKSPLEYAHASNYVKSKSKLERVRIKICGIREPDHARAAAFGGADALGLVFAPGSPRFVNVEQARAICAAVPPFVTIVGLFVDAEPRQVRQLLDQIPLQLLQFHGAESPAVCGGFGKPYLKAIRMGPDVDVRAEAARYQDAAGLLLDAYSERAAGGTGERFDWSRVPQGLNIPIILAGGLEPGNVAAAIRTVRPYGVDVSSGVESSKGVKDPAKIAAFIREVYRVQYSEGARSA